MEITGWINHFLAVSELLCPRAQVSKVLEESVVIHVCSRAFHSIILLAAVTLFSTTSANAQPVNIQPELSRFSAPTYGTDAVAAAIGKTLANATPLMRFGTVVVETSYLTRIYAMRGNAPLFVTGAGLNSQAEELRAILQTLSKYKGLPAEKYWNREIEELWNTRGTSRLAALDILLTHSLITFASDLSRGQIDPQYLDNQYVDVARGGRKTFARKALSAADFSTLNFLVNRGNLVEGLQREFEPHHDQYNKLLASLKSLIDLREQGGWPKIPPLAASIRPATNASAIPIVRERMIQMGFLNSQSASSSTVYDSDLQAAVLAYQKSAKMKQDGIIGNEVVRFLNVDINERIKQIEVNLEKWRWMPRELGARYILVNVAAQELQVVESNQVAMKMDVVTGRLLRPTTIFIDTLSSVILNPYWNPPTNNILQDILPEQRKDANHLAKEHISIYRNATGRPDVPTVQVEGRAMEEVDPKTVNWNLYQNVVPPFMFRQNAGNFNSLGNVKFNLDSNPHAIYLHDTAHDDEHQSLFAKDVRLYSSGCIRLSRPLDLLNYVLKDESGNTEWVPERLQEIFSQPEAYPATSVRLPRSLNVYITYLTSFVDGDGILRFTKDYYGLDSRIADALNPVSSDR